MLKADILQGKLPKRPAVQPFKEIFSELSVVKSLVMRGTRIVIPRDLQWGIIALACEGHQGLTKTKQYLRSRVWFPAMDRKTTDYIETCRPCQAANSRCNPLFLKASQMPDRPWQKLVVDLMTLFLINFVISEPKSKPSQFVSVLLSLQLGLHKY